MTIWRRYFLPLTLGTSAVFRLLWGVTLLVVVGGLAGACSPDESARPLSERVERYWELKQAKRWDEVYEVYLDPQLKDELTKEAFIGKRKLAFDVLSYTVTEAREDGDEATVIVTNESHIPVPAGEGKMRMIRRTVTTEDPWVRREGVWYVSLPG